MQAIHAHLIYIHRLSWRIQLVGCCACTQQIPVSRSPQNELTRSAGGMLRTKAAAPAVRVVVDMREFMSSLPAVLYQQVRSIQNKPIER